MISKTYGSPNIPLSLSLSHKQTTMHALCLHRSFANEERATAKYGDRIDDVFASGRVMELATASFTAGMAFLGNVAMVLVLWYVCVCVPVRHSVSIVGGAMEKSDWGTLRHDMRLGKKVKRGKSHHTPAYPHIHTPTHTEKGTPHTHTHPHTHLPINTHTHTHTSTHSPTHPHTHTKHTHVHSSDAGTTAVVCLTET